MPSNQTLLAISPIDGRYAEKTIALQAYFSEFALFKFRFMIEIHWLYYLLKHHDLLGITAPSEQSFLLLLKKADEFNVNDAEQIKKIEQRCHHDVKAVEYYLKEFLQQHQELSMYQEWVHFGCTSEDINNLAYGLMVQQALQKILIPKLKHIEIILQQKSQDYADIAMLSRTHGQAATPTTLGKEFANFSYRLSRHLIDLNHLPILGKFNGAVGNYNAHHIALPHIDWPKFNQTFVEQLGLTWNPYTTQIEPHDYIADILAKIANIHSVLIDLTRDCWGYISIHYFDQMVQQEAVGSSTMPHKINPIDFENAEGNLSLGQAIAQFLMTRLPISRYQRDLVDSTLMRTIGTIFAYGLISYESLLIGLGKITPNHNALSEDLASHPEILAEAIQTIMRVHNLPIPYEQLKTLTRGQKIDRTILHHFINQLNLPEKIKQHLLSLEPATYLGYATQLAKNI